MYTKQKVSGGYTHLTLHVLTDSLGNKMFLKVTLTGKLSGLGSVLHFETILIRLGTLAFFHLP